MIAPGETIGILGGGQLGRMLAMAAAKLGYRTHLYAPPGDNVAAEVCTYYTCAEWSDRNALANFAADCAVVTYEFENVPVGPLAAIPQDKLAPGPQALEVAQDRLKEKRFTEQHGGRPAPYAKVDSDEDLANAVEQIGTPGILKTRREGYDGKGQWRIGSAIEAQGMRMPGQDLVYEGFIRFVGEFSVILVRGRDGEVRFWDSSENTHDDGILARSTYPPRTVVGGQVEAARELARRIADALGYVGVLTCEFFATERGPVFNEMAPRVHNSGHWTIEGAVTSQFENHVRAILGLPLGSTATRGRRVEMANLIGDEIERVDALLRDPAASLHNYGKAEAREGRKMGHVTWIDREPGE